MNGGINSTVCATIASEAYGPENVMGVNFDLGHPNKLKCSNAIEIFKYLGLKEFKVIKIPREIIDGTRLYNMEYWGNAILDIASLVGMNYGADCIYSGTPRGTNLESKIVTPLRAMSKKAIIRLALRIDTPLHLTQSCYSTDGNPCNVCKVCEAREQAFKDNGQSEEEYTALMQSRDFYLGKSNEGSVFA
jgi:7-cyano-7-deazaguanine synthase in queuosine biosynthesis